MSYYDKIIGYRPNSAIKLNSSQDGYIDASGHGNTLSGTYTFTGSILSGSPKSFSVVGQSPVNTPTNIFKKGMEARPFTLAAWFLPTSMVSGSYSILSHNGYYDGLWFDGDFINFSIRHNDGTYTTAGWPIPDAPKAYYVVGIYTSEKIQLYIDGELQAETGFSDSAAGGFYQEASPNLYVGNATSSSFRATLDGLAIYAHPLSPLEVYESYLAGRDVLDTDTIVMHNGGSWWSGAERDIEFTKYWPEWDDGVTEYASISDGTLVPDVDPTTGLSIVDASWYGTIPVGATENSSIGYVQMEWDGDGDFVVFYSINGGLNFYTVPNGGKLPLTEGLDATSVEVIDVWVKFTGGIADDESILRDMTATIYKNSNVYGTDDSRTVQLSGDIVSNLTYEEPIERSESSGFDLYGGKLIVGADTEESPVNTSAFEIWVKPDSNSNGSDIFDNTGSGGAARLSITAGKYVFSGMSAVYINGQPISSNSVNVEYDNWTHIVLVLSTPSTLGAEIGDSVFSGTIGMLAAYPDALTSSKVDELFKLYSFIPKKEVAEVGAVAVADSAQTVSIYSLTWTQSE